MTKIQTLIKTTKAIQESNKEKLLQISQKLERLNNGQHKLHVIS